jgi:hypothetical protein
MESDYVKFVKITLKKMFWNRFYQISFTLTTRFKN